MHTLDIPIWFKHVIVNAVLETATIPAENDTERVNSQLRMADTLLDTVTSAELVGWIQLQRSKHKNLQPVEELDNLRSYAESFSKVADSAQQTARSIGVSAASVLSAGSVLVQEEMARAVRHLDAIRADAEALASQAATDHLDVVRANVYGSSIYHTMAEVFLRLSSVFDSSKNAYEELQDAQMDIQAAEERMSARSEMVSIHGYVSQIAEQGILINSWIDSLGYYERKRGRSLSAKLRQLWGSRQTYRSELDSRSGLASPERRAATWRNPVGSLLWGAAFVFMLVNWLSMVAFVFIEFGDWGILAFMLSPFVTGLLGTPIMFTVYDAPVLAVITWAPMVISIAAAAKIKP